MAYGLLYGMASRDSVLCFILLTLLYSTFGQTMPKFDVEPEFLAPLENHTVTQGRDVEFTCVVNHLQSYKLAWIKADSKAILAIHTHMIAHNPRLSVTHNGHNTWKLRVANVQSNDSGYYMCQVNTDPMKSQIGYMKVVIPPDIMDSGDDADHLTTKEDGNVRLYCNATGTPKPTVTWKREDGRNITLRNEHGVTRVRSYEGEELNLPGIQRREMGAYLCIASNGVPPTVSKRYHVNVRFKPLVKVTNQLVAAPVKSDVVLQCYIEASPRALNTWYKDNELKNLPSEKYEVFETAINDYSYQLNLTVRHLEPMNFGTYTCSSENELGKAEASIRLQELLLKETTITSNHETNVVGRERKKPYLPDRKGKKYPYTMEKEAEFIPRVIESHTTPMTRKKISNDLREFSENSKQYSSNLAPAPVPAQFSPTQLDTSNTAYSLHPFSGIMVIVITLLVEF